MSIMLPTRAPSGRNELREYLDLDEIIAVLPVARETARRKLVRGQWHGAQFAGRWYMCHDDIADAVAEARGEGTYLLSEPETPPALGTVLDDDALDDVGGVQ